MILQVLKVWFRQLSVFGVILSLANSEVDLPHLEERFRAIYEARNEAVIIDAQKRTHLAGHTNVPSSAK